MQVEITVFKKKYTLIHLPTYRRWKYSKKPIDKKPIDKNYFIFF